MMKSSCQRCLQDHYDVQIPTHCNPLETFCKHNGDVSVVKPIYDYTASDDDDDDDDDDDVQIMMNMAGLSSWRTEFGRIA